MSTRSRPIYTDPDKRTTLDDLASLVTDGAVIAVGGGLSSREPMALLRAILRRGVTGLTVVGSAHGIDIDLLCAGGALSQSSESYVGFEQDFGQAPNYRRALESGAVKVDDSCCYTLVQQLRAAIQGLPFMPIRSRAGHELSIASSRIPADGLSVHRRGAAAGSGDRARRRPHPRAVRGRKGQPRHSGAARRRHSLREGVEGGAGDGRGDRPDGTAWRSRRRQHSVFLRDRGERGADGGASHRLLSLLCLRSAPHRALLRGGP